MQWFEDERFWQTFYPFMFHERRWAAAQEEVEQVIALSGVGQGAVLDLCCGPARHSAILAAKGYRVTGVDRSRFLLSKAREQPAAGEIEFVQADMREFVREGAFDLVINLFTAFGYFDSREEDLVVLRNVRASLKPGGVFIVDVLGREPVAAQTCRTWWEEDKDGNVCVAHASILPGWTRVRSQWLLATPEKTHRAEFFLNAYSGQELSERLREAGFENVEIFGTLAGTPYNDSAKRLVAKAS